MTFIDMVMNVIIESSLQELLFDLREPFNLQKGCLLGAGIGLGGRVISFVNGETPQRETDAIVLLLPLIGSSSISMACLLGITGALAPILEETLFRGLCNHKSRSVPSPLAVLSTAAVFAVAQITPGEFPQLFVLGIVHAHKFMHRDKIAAEILLWIHQR
ncbi:CAAX amino terminal protease family [Olea europaea subsp. europaea]|uniref:CAAX amino terminal protease family n=1 Tax=Olea europaea subsp. europaea TaxID=158383 RepID=A0A8S0UUW4_OLEEU|nr:CAAX amino terminal protease family [Olea europaea subsp. europaea]